ncbi:hypothetical protein HK096_009343, partial [Nowakowskiella sp. JEL0078]
KDRVAQMNEDQEINEEILFLTKAADPEEERERISKYVGNILRLISASADPERILIGHVLVYAPCDDDNSLSLLRRVPIYSGFTVVGRDDDSQIVLSDFRSISVYHAIFGELFILYTA